MRKTVVLSWCVGLLAMLSLVSLPALAQYPGYKAIADRESFKKQFGAESSKILSISSNFTQEKTLAALTEKIVSQGKFSFKRSDKVRLEYTKPFTYLLVMNGDKVLMKDNQKENRVNTKSSKIFQQVNRIMVDCLSGKILDSQDFTSKVFENNDSYLLELTPVSKTLKSFFATILLTIEKKDYSVRTMDMNESGGDTTRMIFKEKKINTTLDDALFAL